MSREELAGIFTARGIPAFALMDNDTTALAHGLLADGKGTIAQISTGIGARALRGGVALTDPDHPDWMMLTRTTYRTWTAPGGRSRPFREWIGWEAVQRWLPPELLGLEYRLLARSGHPALELLADAAVSWLEVVASSTPVKTPFMLGGGGALALLPLLGIRLHRLGLAVGWVDDAETPGLLGLARLLDADQTGV